MKSKSQTTTELVKANAEKWGRFPPMHPGEMLREEFLIPLEITPHALAMALQVPATRIAEIVNEKRGISGDTALRLGLYFRMTPEFWMNLQSRYELEIARDNLGPEFEQAIKPVAVDQRGQLLSRTA